MTITYITQTTMFWTDNNNKKNKLKKSNIYIWNINSKCIINTVRKKTDVCKNLNITENKHVRLLQVLFRPPHDITPWMYKENKIHSENVSEAEPLSVTRGWRVMAG